jgi:hypothetical protein
MIASSFLNHIRHKFGGDGCATLVFLVLSSIREERDDGCYPFGAGNFAGMDHDAELHKSGIDCTTSSVDNIDVVLANRLRNSDTGFTYATSCDFGLGEGQTNASCNNFGKLWVACPREDFDAAPVQHFWEVHCTVTIDNRFKSKEGRFLRRAGE